MMTELSELPYDAETMSDRAEHHLTDSGAIPVRLVGDAATRSDAPQHASWQTYILTGNEPNPVHILSFDRKRSRAFIMVQTNVPGQVQYVRFAKQEQLSANGGGLVASGAYFEYKGAPDVWLIPQPANGGVIVTVLEERNSE